MTRGGHWYLHKEKQHRTGNATQCALCKWSYYHLIIVVGYDGYVEIKLEENHNEVLFCPWLKKLLLCSAQFMLK